MTIDTNISFAQVAKDQIDQMEKKTTTWNGEPSFATTTSARVDFFYAAMRDVEKSRFLQLLDASYREDALHTLKIIAYVRDCRGGKGERLIGRFALTWLAENHPEEIKHNMEHYIKQFGRFDDALALIGTNMEKDVLGLLKKQLEEDLKVLEKLKTQEKENTKPSSTGESTSISLCAKWIPSEKKSADKKLKVNKKISQYMNMTSAQLRKMYLSPLREKLRIVERNMCANEWEAIDFNKVPSVAMHIYGKPNHAFQRHLEEKFSAWKAKLATGKTKVNAKVLYPHEIVSQYFSRYEMDDLLEAQWKVLLEEAKKMGHVKKTLVMSDVSGSMSGRPMEVSIAFGLMISSLAQDEYKDLVMTFESIPRFHHVQGDTLYARVKNLQGAPWGGSTDFAGAFRAILKLAKNKNLTMEQMPERLLVVSDMQFNDADNRGFETNYEILKKEYKAVGYEVPHLVFWNVNGSTMDFPVFKGEAKVSLVSGFSTGILKAVLQGTEITPFQTLLNAILDERYDCITLAPKSSFLGLKNAI
jgi:uncharacterized protein with von Willebrand factor type A (vWA) domain